MKNTFRLKFLRNYESCKVETWYTYGQWADVSCVLESRPSAYNSLLGLQFATNEIFSSHFSQEL